MEKTFLISQLKVIQEHMITFEELQQVKGDDHATGCLLDYNYFNKHKMIAIDLIKQQALDADADNLILVEM